MVAHIVPGASPPRNRAGRASRQAPLLPACPWTARNHPGGERMRRHPRIRPTSWPARHRTRPRAVPFEARVQGGPAVATLPAWRARATRAAIARWRRAAGSRSRPSSGTCSHPYERRPGNARDPRDMNHRELGGIRPQDPSPAGPTGAVTLGPCCVRAADPRRGARASARRHRAPPGPGTAQREQPNALCCPAHASPTRSADGGRGRSARRRLWRLRRG